MDRDTLVSYIRAGGAKIPAETVIKNGKLVHVHSAEILPADVAIYKGRIMAIGDVEEYIGSNTEIIDAKGYYLTPGLIDGHLHIECSKLSMTSFARLVVPHGTTSIVSGLDQYLVIAGMEGVKEVLEEIKQGPLNVFWGLPFVTPYTLPKSTVGFEVNGQTHGDHQNDPSIFGVWETVTEFIENEHPEVLKALEHAWNNNLPIFGCCPLARGKRLNSALCAGVRLDHESYSADEALEKIRKGMFLLIRESSISHFLKENIKVVTEGGLRLSRRVSFCTDDVTPSEVLQNGHMDKLIRMAISCGVDPITAVQMGSLNSAEAYRVDHLVGSIAPGKIANILFVKDLREFYVEKVIAKGQLYVDNGAMAVDLLPPKRSALLLQKPQIPTLKAEDLLIKTNFQKSVHVRSIEVDFDIPFVRRQKDVVLSVKDGVVCADTNQDVLHALVIERFGKNGNKALGFVSGWKLKSGAMASSKAPDDNNIMCIGTNPEDMAIAVNHLAQHGGGQVVVDQGKVIDFISLPICGIVSDEAPEAIARQEASLLSSLRALGSTLPDPMFYMCCLQITAIPDFAMTDLGMVDFHTQQVFDPILGQA
ncbi:MAG: adenine deaminase C-terminal domain-containing protein [Brevinema sp.]